MFCGLAPLCLSSTSLKGRCGGEGSGLVDYLLPMSESLSCLFGSNSNDVMFDSVPSSSSQHDKAADADTAAGIKEQTAPMAASTTARGVLGSPAPLADYPAGLIESSAGGGGGGGGMSSAVVRPTEARVRSAQQHHSQQQHRQQQQAQSVLISPHSPAPPPPQPQPTADSVEGDTPPNTLGSSATLQIALEA